MVWVLSTSAAGMEYVAKVGLGCATKSRDAQRCRFA